MAISLTNQTKTISNVNAAPYSITLDFNPTDDRLLVAVASHRGGTTPDGPAGWSKAVGLGGGSDRQAIWYKVASSEGVTPTYSWANGDSAEHAIIVAEFSGVATTSPLDKTASDAQAGAGTTHTSGTTAALAETGELAVVGIATFITWGGSSPFVSWSNSYTRIDDQEGADASDLSNAMAYKTPVGTTAEESTGTWTTSRDPRYGAIATFKAAAAPAGIAVLRRRVDGY